MHIKPNKLDALKVCLEKLDKDSELIILLVGGHVVDEEVEEIESYIEDNFDAEVDIIEGKTTCLFIYYWCRINYYKVKKVLREI